MHRKLFVMNIHDSAYKKLFSNTTFASDLLLHFIEEPWVHLLDFSRATIIDKSFIADQYKETEADLIYRVPFKNSDKAVYLYLLIEFQSTVDRFMAVRIGHYILSFYLEYRDTTDGVKFLPPIFPILLYNGSDKWSAPSALSELVEQHIDLVGYGVDVRYFPVIINQIPLEKLLAEENIVATLFLAEQRYDIQLLLEKLLALYEAGEHKAVSLLANWYRQMVLHKRVRPEDYERLESEIRSKEELRLMVVETIEKGIEKVIEQAVKEAKVEARNEGIDIGKKEGIDIGKEEGIQEARRQVVHAMTDNGFDSAAIARMLNLPEDEVKRLLGMIAESGK